MSEMPEFDDLPEGETVAELHYHIVLWTPQLRPALSRDALAKACEEMDQALFTVGGEALAAGGSANHLHILARLSHDHSVREALDALRRRSEAWVARAGGARGFVWELDEMVVSIDPEELDAARAFIQAQESHHEIVSFAGEMKALFDEYGFDCDGLDVGD